MTARLGLLEVTKFQLALTKPIILHFFPVYYDTQKTYHNLHVKNYLHWVLVVLLTVSKLRLAHING
jgi:hypothetical protein